MFPDPLFLKYVHRDQKYIILAFDTSTYVRILRAQRTASHMYYVRMWNTTLHKAKLAQATQALTKGSDSFDVFKAHFAHLGPLGVTRY